MSSHTGTPDENFRPDIGALTMEIGDGAMRIEGVHVPRDNRQRPRERSLGTAIADDRCYEHSKNTMGNEPPN
jgi:hypothetical protein